MNQLPKNVAFIARDSGSKRKEKYIFYHFFEAEKFQAAKAYYNALLHWNKVLSHVPAGIDLSYVYMQRSKIYEDSSLPAECLNNNFLSHSLNTYDVEKIKVRQILRECSEANSFMELSYKANPKMPFVIDGLKLKCDTAFGLHVIAEHVLNIGDIICVENALFTFLTSKSNDINFEKNSSYQRCHHCLISTKMDMVSCMECKSEF